MVEIARSKTGPKICPYWRKISVVLDETGCQLIALCGRESLDEKRLPPLRDFRRRTRCPQGEGADDLAYAIPAIVMQKYTDSSLSIPVSSLIIARVAFRSGLEGIRELENKWEQEIEKIRLSSCPH